MGKYMSFQANVVPQRSRNFPKKILLHKKIQINKQYAFTASLWVANTPESNHAPTATLVLSHSYHKVRLCFNSVTDLQEAISELLSFVRDKSFDLHKALVAAQMEFLEFHEQQKLQHLNDNTKATVIQDISVSKYAPKRKYVNKLTGEILELG